MNKQLKTIFTVLIAYLTIHGLLLIMFPQICDFLGWNYKITLLVFWIPLIFNMIVISSMWMKIEYGEAGFEHTNAFGLTRVFQYDEVIEIIDKGRNVRIITARKNILLFNSFSGVRSFAAYIKEKNPNIKY